MVEGQKGDSEGRVLRYLALGLGIGAAAGFIAGMLLAPKPGSEMRADVTKAIKTAADNIRGIDEGEDAEAASHEGETAGLQP